MCCRDSACGGVMMLAREVRGAGTRAALLEHLVEAGVVARALDDR